MAGITDCLTMPRILGCEKKNRVQVRVYVERELIQALKAHTLEPNDTVNIALEKHLRDKGVRIITGVEHT